ncbi:complement regulator-acquiring protein [Borreliella lusitaniae]|uniref:complement regulator-acquiring protein n=1 Tax=Borreliella lusitaniae TaxID=100177 RepID=UPI00292E49CB|nr:complement regulator-acquiring protein [Borreliella lusitaniae]WNY67344.1 complement regulator-acquiring protein [Borreliella lusitaniae]
MTKLKLNMIKLNIIKVALALICISCTPTGTLPPAELNKEILKKNKDFNPFDREFDNHTITRTQKHTKSKERTITRTQNFKPLKKDPNK